jgi:hypothetical protein
MEKKTDDKAAAQEPKAADTNGVSERYDPANWRGRKLEEFIDDKAILTALGDASLKTAGEVWFKIQTEGQRRKKEGGNGA